MLFITLPAGRKLAYVKPKMGEKQFGGEAVIYEGTGTAKHWERLESYGPKLVENIVQAINRDILAYSMKQLKEFKIVGYVHDEVIMEREQDQSLKVVANLMEITSNWVPDINCKRSITKYLASNSILQFYFLLTVYWRIDNLGRYLVIGRLLL